MQEVPVPQGFLDFSGGFPLPATLTATFRKGATTLADLLHSPLATSAYDVSHHPIKRRFAG